jgi:hypothetical protein
MFKHCSVIRAPRRRRATRRCRSTKLVTAVQRMERGWNEGRVR